MENKKEKIAAVVVTYNRKELLKECLDALLAQTHPLDSIILIDNASTDGTPEFLKEKGFLDNPKIDYVRLSENSGGAGGFYEGMKRGYEKGFDWLWLMDDDAKPANDALEKLCMTTSSTSTPENLCFYSAYMSPDGKRFTEPIGIVEGNQTISYLELKEILKHRVIEGTGGPFLGFLLPRRVVEQIGLPRNDTFIWGDYEYLFRIRESGFKIYYNFNSIIWHPPHTWKGISLPYGLFKLRRPIMRQLLVPLGPSWKEYYCFRNRVYFSIRLRKLNFLQLVKNFIKITISAFIHMLIVIYYTSDDSRIKMAKYCLKGIWDGLWGKMGITVKP